jgi:hypothetical protein
MCASRKARMNKKPRSSSLSCCHVMTFWLALDKFYSGMLIIMSITLHFCPLLCPCVACAFGLVIALQALALQASVLRGAGCQTLRTNMLQTPLEPYLEALGHKPWVTPLWILWRPQMVAMRGRRGATNGCIPMAADVSCHSKSGSGLKSVGLSPRRKKFWVLLSSRNVHHPSLELKM